MKTCLLAMDVETQRTRAVLVNRNGRVLTKATYENVLQTPQPGWAQQDANEWWTATIATIRDVLDQSRVAPAEIACVVVDSQMHAASYLIATGKYSCPRSRYGMTSVLPK